jgi:phenylalanyl-tRNA synthetase beta chain
VRLRRDRIAGLLGTPVPDADVRRILEGLGFALRDADDGWAITVPTRRVDIAREVDLIEEVARHYGFDRIPMTFPALRSAPPPSDPRLTRARQLRAAMTGAGFSETVTFGFIAESAAASFAPAADIVSIANPLAETFAVLRPSLLPGLAAAVGHNRRHEQHDVRLFEIGARFNATSGEGQAIACAWLGAASAPHWSGGGRGVDLFDVKGIVGRICDVLRVEAEVQPADAPAAWLVPGRSATVVSGGRTVGLLGQLAPAIAEPAGVPVNEAVYVAEIDLDALTARAITADRRVEPLPRYPSVTRDISVLVDDTLGAAVLRQTVRDAAPSTLVSVREFDRYQGKGIPEQKVSLSLRLTFRSPDRTLTDAEVQAAMDAVLRLLTEKHGAVQR